MAQGCDAAPSCQIMEITKKRRLSDIVLGLFLLSHPGPVLLHIIAVTLFALLAAWPRLAWGIIALVVAAHAAMQLSIAMVNDYSDRQLDAESKPGKPIPRGLVRPVEALFCGLLLIVLGALLIAVLTLTQAVPVRPFIITLALILTCLSVAAMIVFFGPAKPPWSRKVYFYLVVLTCILLAGGWLGGAIA